MRFCGFHISLGLRILPVFPDFGGFINNYVDFAVLHVFLRGLFKILLSGFSVLGTPQRPPILRKQIHFPGKKIRR